ncbi:YpfN family protein [Serratia microhaemolytica]|uniref:YpfN family protein n=1 Tax=Serratia microhaemolytica TaxID=2675110 RepID=UPI000FDD61BA|nr:YpfN family protein [Serratia microhaemolytica]
MAFLADYWWIILVLLVGIFINNIKALTRLDHRKYLANKPTLPPHRDNNAKWDQEQD